jgi:branched-subunit amino acid permease
MANIATELTIRVCIITAIYSIISYSVIQRDIVTLHQLGGMSIPLLFVTYGVAILISILYCLRKYHVWNSKK